MSTAVLLLNASYEPIRPISFRRAMSLIVEGRAETVASVKDKFVHSPSKTFDWPSVVRLIKYVKIPWKKTRVAFSKKNVLVRDSHECCYCDKRKADSIDHVLPRSRGGENSWTNLVASCVKCNTEKSDRTPEEAGMKMRFQPFAPASEVYLEVHSRYSTNRSDWLEYLDTREVN